MSNEKWTLGMRGQVLLTKSPNWFGERKEGERPTERERDLFRERSSHFSLKLPTIGPSVFGKARSKVAPHGKGYKWVPVLGSFNKLWKVGFFSYLFYSLAKGHVMDGDLLRPGWPWFRFQKIWTE